MADHWTARQRDDGYWYVEQADGTAILATIGTPATDRERVARLASLAPKMLAACDQAISDLQGVCNYSDNDIVIDIAQHIAANLMSVLEEAQP